MRSPKIIIPLLLCLLCTTTAAAVQLSAPAGDAVDRSTEDAFLKAFYSSESDFSELTVQSWGKIDDRFRSSAELQQLYDKLKKELNAGGDLLSESYGDEIYSALTVRGYCAEGYYLELMLRSIGDDFEEDETYLIVNITETRDCTAATAIVGRAESLFSALDATAETNILIAATYDHLLTQREKVTVAKRVFADGGGEILESVEDGSYVSQSGFYPGLGEGVRSQGRNINLQIAIFDNESRSQSQFYIGTPLVFSEY